VERLERNLLGQVLGILPISHPAVDERVDERQIFYRVVRSVPSG